MKTPQDFRNLLDLLESVQVNELNSKSRAAARMSRGGRNPELADRRAPQELIDIYDNGPEPKRIDLDPEGGHYTLPFGTVYSPEKKVTIMRPMNGAGTIGNNNANKIRKIFDGMGKREGIDYEINIPSALIWVKGRVQG